jgi:3-carboxy-cis,cis-muconate cycloisomerase
MPVSVIDSRIFRNIFGTEDIRLLFEDKSYAYYMITVEAALARAQSKIGVIPPHIGDAITAGCHASKLEYVRTRRVGLTFPCPANTVSRQL